MLDVRLYLAQRLSAMLMVPLVLGHLVVMTYAIRGGLTTAQILARTRGSVFFMLFYGLFALAVSVHAAIGLRVILHETARVTGVWLTAFTVVAGIGLLLLGEHAVLVVTWP